jgi:hypothetical protein
MNRYSINPIQIRFKKSDQFIKPDYYVSGMNYISAEDAWDYFRSNNFIKMEIVQTRTHPNNDTDLHPHLVRMLKAVEPHHGDIKLLNRIIKNGGFISYINKLEQV